MSRRMLTTVRNIMFALLVVLCTGIVPRSYAQEPPPTAVPGASGAPAVATLTEDIGDTISFERLGYIERLVRGPSGSVRLSFNVPANWKLSTPAELQLNVATFLGTGLSAANEPAPGGSLTVWLNDVTLTTLLLDRNGERKLTIPLTADALRAANGNHHTLRIALSTDLGCEVVNQTSVVVRGSSQLVLPHTLVSPPTDLAFLPWPLFQQSFLPDIALLVVPDKPSAAELQAALAVAAGFGRMTGGSLGLMLTPVSQLNPALRDANHLIFVGKAPAFSLLNAAPLPAPITEAAFTVGGSVSADGIIEMMVSPWNSGKVALVVGGNDDEALIKAGQAISSGQVRSGSAPNLALVADVQTTMLSSSFDAINRTFGNLGYEIRLLDRIGSSSAEYRFFIPPGQQVDKDAYVDLVFNHSALLDYDKSGFTVLLNDEPIGSLRFSDDSAKITTIRFAFPPAAIRTGRNRLVVRADLASRVSCSTSGQEDIWLSIRPESALSLPLIPAQGSGGPLVDLAAYPDPFTLSPTLGTTAFVLPNDDPAAWNVAAQIAGDLGDKTDGALVGFVVTYADDVPERIRQEHDLLMIGRPSRLPLIGELNSALPAPFESGDDRATERGSRVVYRLPPGASVGYLQLLPAPWNPARAVLAVLGTTDEGLAWAGAALTKASLRSKLIGTFASLNGEQVTVNEAQVNAPTSAVELATTPAPSGAQPTAATTPVPTSVPSSQGGQQGSSTLSIVGLLAIIGGIAFGGVMVWLGRRRPSEKPEE